MSDGVVTDSRNETGSEDARTAHMQTMSATATRFVNLGPALSAAVALLDEDDRDVVFGDWFTSPHAGAPRGLAVGSALTVDQVEGLLPEVPDTAMGRAWAAAAREQIEATRQRAWKSYDCVDLTNERGIKELLHLAEVMESLSPLLQPVADTLYSMTSPGDQTIGEYREIASRLTADGFDIASDPTCTKHEECTHRIPLIALWSHLEEIAGEGTEASIRNSVARVLAALPKTEDDNR
jgi:hypothetical protein